MNKVFDVKCVCEDKVFNVLLQYEPMNGLIFMDGNGVEYEIVNTMPIINIANPNNKQEINYSVCVVRECNPNIVGVPQFKFIQGDTYEEMENNLNKFLYDNRGKFVILGITHAVGYVAVEYVIK